MTSLSVRVLGVTAAAALVTTALTAPSVAGVSPTRHHDPVEPTVVASGLNSPRHLTVASNGDLYVAEAGTGGDDCVVLGDEGEPVFGDDGALLPCGSWDPDEHPDWGEIRLGDTGSITKVSRRGHQQRVVTGLPSIDLGGGEGTGPSDVAVKGNRLMITVGMGAPPEAREMMVALFDDDTYEGFATVQEARLRGKHHVTLREVADLAQFETDVNPHPDMLDTNPNAIAKDGNGWLLTDAGGNSVIRLSKHGNLSTVAVPPGGMAEAPPFLELPPGTMIPFEPVPTAAERGKDGAVYVSLLTGFPFPVGGSSIWRIAKDGSMTEWATGLTNVTDLTWANGKLYAVQLADNGLLSGDMTGSLVRVRKGSDTHTVIADGLFAPYGVAVHRNSAYVTTGTVLPGGGEVLKIDLRRRH